MRFSFVHFIFFFFGGGGSKIFVKVRKQLGHPKKLGLEGLVLYIVELICCNLSVPLESTYHNDNYIPVYFQAEAAENNFDEVEERNHKTNDDDQAEDGTSVSDKLTNEGNKKVDNF